MVFFLRMKWGQTHLSPLGFTPVPLTLHIQTDSNICNVCDLHLCHVQKNTLWISKTGHTKHSCIAARLAAHRWSEFCEWNWKFAHFHHLDSNSSARWFPTYRHTHPTLLTPCTLSFFGTTPLCIKSRHFILIHCNIRSIWAWLGPVWLVLGPFPDPSLVFENRWTLICTDPFVSFILFYLHIGDFTVKKYVGNISWCFWTCSTMIVTISNRWTDIYVDCCKRDGWLHFLLLNSETEAEELQAWELTNQTANQFAFSR